MKTFTQKFVSIFSILFVKALMVTVLSVPLAQAAELAWSTPVLVETGAETASSPRIAVDQNGNVMAVWVQSDGTTSGIYANRYVSGSGWGTPTLLETSAMPADSPNIAAGANGNFIAVWRQAWKTVNGNRYGIYANRYVAGTGWGTAAVVYVDTQNSDVTANADAQVAVDPNGNAIAVWSVYDWSWNHTSVRANSYVADTGWSGVTNLSTEAVQMAYGANIAMDSTGNAMVVWRQGTGAAQIGDKILADRYTVGTGWGTPVSIATSCGTYDCNSPQVAFDPSGNAIAVWYDDGKPGIHANRYVAGTGWGAATAIADTGTTSYDEGVRLAIDKNGNAIAVWNQNGGVLYANRYVAGTGWGTTAIIDSNGSAHYSEQIAFDKNGNAIAVWGTSGCNSNNIQAIPYVVGTGWGTVKKCYETGATFVNKTLNNAGEPQLVIDNNGNATVVWVQSGSIYASTTAALGQSCTLTLSSTSQTFTSAGGTGTVTVTASGSSCAWTASSSLSWVTITSGTSGTGSGTATFSVSANTSTSSRTGSLTIASQTFAITQSGSGGSTTNLLLNPGFESGNVNWTESYLATTPDITNDSTHAHTGSWFAWFGGYSNAVDSIYQDVAIPSTAQQPYLQFWYSISTYETTTSSANDKMAVEIRKAADNTLLAALATLSNLNKTSGYVQSQQYDLSAFKGQTIRLRFSATTNSSLSTSFLIDDVSISSMGSTSSCTYTISPTSKTFNSTGGSGTVTVTASSSTCAWTATESLDWVSITSGSKGTGNGTVSYSVSKNTTKAVRTGNITIAGKTFAITQKK